MSLLPMAKSGSTDEKRRMPLQRLQRMVGAVFEIGINLLLKNFKASILKNRACKSAISGTRNAALLGNQFSMKNIPTKLSVLAVTLASFSLVHADPALVDQYLFQNNLNDSVGSSPIVNSGGATLGNGSLTFGKDDGPTLEVNPSLADSYSIGLQFELSLPNSDGDPWTSIVNLSNLVNDDFNQYLYDGNPDFYSISGEVEHSDVIPSDTVVDMIMTWDGTNYDAYLNGTLVDSFSQAGAANAVVVNNAAIFWLFVDDGHGAEATSGVLYQADVWNGALSASDVENFDFAPYQQSPSVPDSGSLLPIWTALLGVMAVARRRVARLW